MPTLAIAGHHNAQFVLRGSRFTPKDYRAALGTDTAVALIKSMPHPKLPKEYRADYWSVITRVSEMLGNTATVAGRHYVAPEVFSGWRASAGVAT